MKTAEVVYLGNLRTECAHIRSGDKFFTDAPVDNKGRGEAFSPTDLTATSLATCMITTMAIAAGVHEIPFEEAAAEVLKIMTSDPRRIAAIEVDLYLTEETYTEKQIKILEKAALTCPVSLSLHPDIKQIVRFHWKNL